MKTKSFNDYMSSKLREMCKIYYYKNNMTSKLPQEMIYNELLSFVAFNNLQKEYNDIRTKVKHIFFNFEKKFEEAKIPEDVLCILHRLYIASKDSFLVGGCTRDILLGEKAKDYDFVTDISYEELKNIFPECKFKESGTEFLVFNLNYNSENYEIANFRKDSKSSDSRHPDLVEIGTIEEDQDRRDFTVNNIAWNPQELIISVQSVDDILERKLRFVGVPEERLQEDFLRGWRFLRLLKTKNLIPDKNSLKAVRRNWNKIYETSNPQRVILELEKMCL